MKILLTTSKTPLHPYIVNIMARGPCYHPIWSCSCFRQDCYTWIWRDVFRLGLVLSQNAQKAQSYQKNADFEKNPEQSKHILTRFDESLASVTRLQGVFRAKAAFLRTRSLKAEQEVLRNNIVLYF